MAALSRLQNILALMDLVLWRHADAHDGFPDLARELTTKGLRQAAEMAKWLKLHLPNDTEILVSPAVRAQQTAQALTHKFKTVSEIEPGAAHEAVLSAAGWPDHKGTVLVVGHQPTLGQTAAWLLSGEVADWGMKKGAVWWFTNRARGEQRGISLRAAMAPDLV
jgi:phosphohistidine phosphatase